MPEFFELTEKSQLIQDDSHCVYCHTDLLVFEKVATCHECGSPHHAECWQANSNRCATFGCTGRGGGPSLARDVVRQTTPRATTTTSPSGGPHAPRQPRGAWLSRRRFFGILAFIGMIFYTSVFEADPSMQQTRSRSAGPIPLATPAPTLTPTPTQFPVPATATAAPANDQFFPLNPTPNAGIISPLETPLPFVNCANATRIMESDCDLLVDIYNSTNGPEWAFNTGWLRTDAPCNWYGIDCIANRVTKIQLSRNKLVGTLPQNIGDLNALTSLIITGGRLSGELPASLGQIERLTTLVLDNNFFSGEIPAELGQSESLRTLYLHNNNLSGAIPPEFEQLTHLSRLNVSSNRLSGPMPEWMACAPDMNGSHNQLTVESERAAACLARNDRVKQRTQTTAPIGLTARQRIGTQIRLTWTPALYDNDGGYFEIGRSADGGETYTVVVRTDSKRDASVTISNANEPSGEYVYAVRSVTPARVGQKNKLTSEYSLPISIN